ncbi:MAG: sugar phosphate isomerase/epimerase [Candidatus Hydrogenedentes bacterium]|nr:sugar phosphate isomerase/epimerase [Candidatus Hydrogenedentota bacterium]
MSSPTSRRIFFQRVAQTAAIAAGVQYALGVQAQTGTAGAPAVCVFSKHLKFQSPAGLAKTCRELKLDGVDLTVRPGGHVLPERVKADLPEAVRVIRGEGLEVPMITTALNDGQDETAQPILETAASLGIPYFRMGGQQYVDGSPALDQLKAFTDSVRRLIAIADAVGITAGYHNHSGAGNVGGALWDLREMIETINSPRFGSNFDVGHSVAEGAYGAWKLNTEVMAPHVKMMAVKDFAWKNNKPAWGPLGEGVVPLVEQLRIVRAAGFAGPISIHVEYDVDGDAGMIEEIRKAAQVLRKALSDAGYPA